MSKFASTLATVVCCAAYGFAQGPLFAPAPVVVGESKSGGVFLVDLNHDGHLDLVTTHILQKRLAVWSGDGKGHFVPTAQGSMDFDVTPGAVALGDVNNDGILDLGVSSKVGKKESVRIFLGNRGGGFNSVSGPLLAVGESAEGRDYKPVLRFADLNGDGNLDLVSANGWRNSIEIFLGDGHGGFSPGPVVKLEQGAWIFWFALGDLDGDGHLDLVTSIPGQLAESAAGRVETRRGGGKGGFAITADQTLLTAPDPHAAAIVDVNGDGHPDIVLSHGHTNILSILLNDGHGKFTKRHGAPINVGWPAADLVAVDINRDGHIDLVATTVDPKAPFASKVVVLLGDGQGEFTPAAGSPFPVGAGAYRLTVGDVNEDGKLDIAASSFESGGVTLLLGR
ncbi:MAG TPA: VCBS repeat-containing protein [Candidatus Binatia bacterium]|jgi:hypothetical protein|nr:VCBS repeat-containing protein [Candidatus Binatia bacterium]